MPSIIHETILRDITDLIGDAKDLMDDGNKLLDNDNYSKRFTSLTRNANNLILVFPVLCHDIIREMLANLPMSVRRIVHRIGF